MSAKVFSAADECNVRKPITNSKVALYV
ncbi:protein of unknown function [Micropruina glycogenica]|uniref:Uncharacterized protein n=1 Tax=Micropruina glycogenica TaxID=75385 RepID=A0A2N9JC97_9ACTN|nr:protein of unknown function [Micropruina glycogenica]